MSKVVIDFAGTEGMALFIGHEPPATTDNFYQAPQAKA